MLKHMFRGRRSTSVHSSAVVFRFHKVGWEMSQTKENRMLFMSATGRRDGPDPPSRSVALSLPILSCSALTSSGKKQVLTRQKQQLIHRQWVYTQVQTDKHKSRNQLQCCVLELQRQHPNTMYVHWTPRGRVHRKWIHWPLVVEVP